MSEKTGCKRICLNGYIQKPNGIRNVTVRGRKMTVRTKHIAREGPVRYDCIDAEGFPIPQGLWYNLPADSENLDAGA